MAKKPEWLTRHGRPWTRGEPRPIYDNPWISVTEFDAIAPTGRPALYGLVGFKNRAMAILPLHEDGTTVLVGQNRLPFSDYSWEIPEGGCPLDEDLLTGAQRELREETGLEAATWQEVLRVQLSNSVTDELAIGYLATGLTQVEEAPEGDGTEDIVRVRVPFHMAKEGGLPRNLATAMLG
jgi:8-oxo-dGDP phosphatase